MFSKAAKRLTGSLVSSGVISESDFVLYSFGFETGFAIITNILVTLSIGLVFGMLLESLLFLAAFIPLRSYVGGIHASSHFRCFWLSIVAVAAVLMSVRYALNLVSVGTMITLGVISTAIMFFLVPVQDANRPLDETDIRVFRRRARMVMCFEVVVLAVLLSVGLKTAAFVMLCTSSLVCLSVCAGAAKNRFARPSVMND